MALEAKRRQIHRTERQWRELIASWKASGKSRRLWCQEHGVSCESLRRWTKRLRHAAINPPLVELPRTLAMSEPATTLQVRITREGELELCGLINGELLCSLVRVLRQTSGVR